MPVPIVPAVQSLRSVQNVELGDAVRPKLALLYWICRRSDKGHGRGQQSIELSAKGKEKEFGRNLRVQVFTFDVAYRTVSNPASFSKSCVSLTVGENARSGLGSGNPQVRRRYFLDQRRQISVELSGNPQASASAPLTLKLSDQHLTHLDQRRDTFTF